MKKFFNLNTKAGVAVGMVIIMLLATNAGSRTINDGSDTALLQISNSMGNYSSVTQAHLQRAVWDCNVSHGGWVMLPQGHGLNTAILNNPWSVALINMSGYNSSKWDSGVGIVNSFKGKWNATSSNLVSYGLIWNASRTTLLTSAPLWNATRSLLSSCSPLWNSTRAVVSAKSAAWNSTADVVTAKRAVWNASASNLVTYGLLWNNTKSVLFTNGPGWNNTKAVVSSRMANWNTSYNIVNAYASKWNATSALVAAKSDAWNTTTSPGHNDTVISNSLGHWWAATGANVQLAINDIGTYGTVWVGSDVTLTTGLLLDSNDGVIVDFQGNRVTLGADVSFINLTDTRNAQVRNANVYTYGSGAYQHEPIIHVILISGDGWFDHIRGNLFENINIVESTTYSAQHNWTGIHIEMQSDSDIAFCVFRNIRMYGCYGGINLSSAHSGAWANGCVFQDIMIDRHVEAVTFFDPYGDSFNRNDFTNIKTQVVGPVPDPNAGYTEPIYGFKNISGVGNTFTNCLVWDWVYADDPQYTWWIGPEAEDTKIDSAVSEDFKDEGLYTLMRKETTGAWYDNRPYEYVISKEGGYYVAKRCSDNLVRYNQSNFRLLLYYTMTPGWGNARSIMLKKGTYNWGDGTAISSPGINNTIIMGESKDSVIIQVEAGDSLSSMFYMNPRCNFTLRDLTIDGNYRGGSSLSCVISALGGTSNINIENCVIKDIKAAAFYSMGAVKNIRITDNTFLNCCLEDQDHAVIYTTNAVDGLYISGNRFKWTQNPTSLMYGMLLCKPAATMTAKNIMIHNNIVLNGGFANVDKGLYLNGDSSHYNLTNASVSDNIIYADDEACHLLYCNNTLISGNVFWGGVDGYLAASNGTGVKFDATSNLENGS